MPSPSPAASRSFVVPVVRMLDERPTCHPLTVADSERDVDRSRGAYGDASAIADTASDS
jgi:hypothetical protein